MSETATKAREYARVVDAETGEYRWSGRLQAFFAANQYPAGPGSELHAFEAGERDAVLLGSKTGTWPFALPDGRSRIGFRTVDLPRVLLVPFDAKGLRERLYRCVECEATAPESRWDCDESGMTCPTCRAVKHFEDVVARGAGHVPTAAFHRLRAAAEAVTP